MQNIFESFLIDARKEADTTAHIEKQGQNIWDVVNSPARYYETTFSPLLRGIPGGESKHPLKGVIDERRKNKGRVFVMDAMGQGRFYESYSVDGEVANSLKNPRNEMERLIDAKRGMEFIEGDILLEETQTAIDDFINKNKEKMNGGFDFVFCRPKAGWSVIIPNDHAGNPDFVQFMQWYVANNIYRVLSPDGGSALIDFAWDTTNPDPLYNAILNEKTISTQREIKKILITRNPNSPQTLPSPWSDHLPGNII